MWDDLNRKLLNVSHCVINHRSFNGELINRQWQHVCVCVFIRIQDYILNCTELFMDVHVIAVMSFSSPGMMHHSEKSMCAEGAAASFQRLIRRMKLQSLKF